MIAGYIKVSGHELANEELSLSAQARLIRAYAEAKGMTGPIEIYMDPDPSLNEGKTYDPSGSNLERPALKLMIEDIRKGKIDTVITINISRLSRNLRDLQDLMAFLDRHSVSCISIEENWNTNTTVSNFLRDMIFARAIIPYEHDQGHHSDFHEN